MTTLDTSWVLNAGGGMLLAGSLLFLVYLGISLYHLKQLHFAPYRLLTEGVKLLGAILLLLTLFQPEIHRRSLRNEAARIAVIRDVTDSMQTQDVLSGNETITRNEWVETLMQSEAWEALAEAVEIQVVEMGHADKPVFKETNFQSALAAARNLDQLAAVLVLSDGGHNAVESPLPEILRLSAEEIPAYSIEVGDRNRLPDLVLEDVRFPSYSIMNEALVLPIRVRNTLPDTVPAQVRLLANGLEAAALSLTVRAGSTAEGSLRWVPRSEGAVSLKVVVDPHPVEVFLDNNERDAEVDIRRTTIRVLLIDSVPRWEYRFLRNALQRDPGVEVDSLLFHPEIGIQSGPGFLAEFPETRDAWSSYDVVFVGDVGQGDGELKPEDIRNLDVLVREQGSGLVFLPGPRGGHLRLLDTPLASLMPVEYDTDTPAGMNSELEMRMELTREGREHLLTQLHGSPNRNLNIWRNLPGFHWYAGVIRARVGSEVLATHNSRRNESGRIPLLATRNAGTGHVLFLGTDAAWRWRRGVEDLYHYRFWGQVVRWMAHKRHMFGDEGARLFTQPERPQVGQDVTLTLSLRGAMGLSEETPFQLRIRHEGGDVVSPSVTGLEGGGTYQSRWSPQAPGTYEVELWDPEGGSEPWFRAEVPVEGEVPEKIGEPTQPGYLREMAQVTGGQAAGMAEAAEVLERLRRLPREQQVLTVERIWQHPFWVASLFVFFALYWILRKRQGWI
ncbi:MAG: hypothetical protein WD708_01550 [Kiritimatiellia bacterium]